MPAISDTHDLQYNSVGPGTAPGPGSLRTKRYDMKEPSGQIPSMQDTE